MKPKWTHSPEGSYLRLRAGKVDRSSELCQGQITIVLDLDVKDQVVGIEFLGLAPFLLEAKLADKT